MGRRPCQITACLMPVVVLLCSVYCACGGHFSFGGSEPVPQRKASTSRSHCSPHQSHCDEHDSQPDRRHDQKPGCGHCESTVAVLPTKVGGIDPPTAVPFAIAALALVSVGESTSVAVVPALRPGGLSPRVHDASLLGQHCALTL
jgi:hypothetical protein